jgi:hypothetical protein
MIKLIFGTIPMPSRNRRKNVKLTKYLEYNLINLYRLPNAKRWVFFFCQFSKLLTELVGHCPTFYFDKRSKY